MLDRSTTNRSIAAVVATLLGIGAIGGAVLAIVAFGKNPGTINATDILGFAGSLLGTFLAVAGAVLVENWRRSTEQKRAREFFISAIDGIEAELTAKVGLYDPGQPEKAKGTEKMDLEARVPVIDAARMRFDAAAARLTQPDYSLVEAVSRIRTLIENHRLRLVQAQTLAEEISPDTPDLVRGAIMYGGLGRSIDTARICKEARDLLTKAS